MSQEFAPTDFTEYVGNKESIDKVKECISKKIPVLLVGNPGIGKTTAIRLIAESEKLKIIEVNSSDERDKTKLAEYVKRVQMGSFIKLLYVFEEVDGSDKGSSRYYKDIIMRSRYPLAFTCNDQYKVPEEIIKQCEIVKFAKPNLSEVVTRVKQIATKQGIKQPNYQAVTTDVRNSVLASIYNTESYRPDNDFEKVNKLFTKNEMNYVPEKDLNIWLIDNVPNFYAGLAQYEVYELIALADRTHVNEILKLMPKGKGHGSVAPPYFFKRLKARRTVKEVAD